MPQSSNGPSLCDMALEQARQQEGPLGGYRWTPETTLLFLGSSGVGKTTLIHRFLERDEAAKPTLALDYTFGRKLNKSILAKEVCHIWELGGGTLHSDSLLSTPTSPERLKNLTAVLMVDLSKPTAVWTTLHKLVTALRTSVTKSIGSVRDKEERKSLSHILKEQTQQRIGKDHPDRKDVDPLPIPLVILGGKYDMFQELEPEVKKVVCRVLRYYSHASGATLQFYSAKDMGLVKRAKEILTHHAFHGPPGKVLSQDYNKPLLIPAGADSFELIGGPSGQGALEQWKQVFYGVFPKGTEKEVANPSYGALPEDPAKDLTYREPQVDKLRTMKDEELQRYRMELEHKHQRNMAGPDVTDD